MGYTYGGSGGRSSSSFTGASPGNYGNGYTGPINFGTTQYTQGAGATQANPWGGDAGIRATNFGTTPSYQMPSFGNTMGGGNAFGGTASSAGPGAFGNSLSPGSWNLLAAGTRANQNPSMFAGGTPSLWGGANNSGLPGGSSFNSPWDPQGVGYQATQRIQNNGFGSPWDPQGTGFAATQRLANQPSNWGGNAFAGTNTSGGWGSVANSLSNYASGGGSQGVLTSQNAVWPNPGTSLYSDNASKRGAILTGLYGNEYAPTSGTFGGINDPYQIMPNTMQTAGIRGQPMNPQTSYQGASNLVDRYSQYPWGGQVASAFFMGPGNVNRNYNPSIPGSVPYASNVAQNQANNVTPQAYIYGKPGYPGFNANATPAVMNAASAQFQQAAAGGANNSGLWGGR